MRGVKHYHKNPRRINEKQAEQLKKWLAEYGDLSGIVHNIKTDEVIGGNQRADVMQILSSKVKPVITKRWAKPTKQGTVAIGYYDWQGERYSYRRVSWTPRKADAANVIANKAGGDWDFEILKNEFASADLLDWGFQKFELNGTETNDPNKEWEGMPEFNQKDLSAMKAIRVNFASQEDIDKFSKLVKQKITLKTRSIWYPKAEKIDMSSELYKDES